MLHRKRALLLALIGLVLAVVARAQQAPATADPIANARKFRNPSAVIQTLTPWLQSSAGDARQADARKLLDQAYEQLHAAFAKAGMVDAAFETLIRHSAFLAELDAQRSQGKRADALKYARSAADDEKTPIELVRHLAQLFHEAFPSEDVLVTNDRLNKRTLAQLAAATRQRASAGVDMAPQLAALLAAGLDRKTLADAGVKPDVIFESRVRELAAIGWLSESTRYALLVSAGQEKLIASNLAALAKSLNALGNPGMARNVTEQSWFTDLAPLHPAQVGTFRNDLKKLLAMTAQGQELKILTPVTANVEWSDLGGGLVANARVQIGTADFPDGKRQPGQVVVREGSRISGGTLLVHEGLLRFAGTSQRPIVVEGVTLQGIGQGGSHIEATNTLFIDCKLERATGYAATPANFAFDGCILFRSNFTNLSRESFHVFASQTAFVDCTLPEVTPREKEETGDADHGTNAKDGYQSCDFIRCAVAPSLALHTAACNFQQCTVLRGDVFRSGQDRSVALFASEPLFAKQLMANMPSSSFGTYNVEASSRPFPRKPTNPRDARWTLLPCLTSATAPASVK